MQPKSYVNPRIALLNIELELKAEKDNAEVRVDSVEVGRWCKFPRIFVDMLFTIDVDY